MCLRKVMPLLGVVAVVTGCVFPTSPDRRVARLTRRAVEAEPAVTTNTLADALQSRAPVAGARALSLDQNTVLNIATRHAPGLQTRREQLYLSALSLSKTRRAFGLQLSGALKFAMELAGDSKGSEAGQLTLGARQLLPLGGDVSVSAGAATTRGSEATNGAATATYGSTIGVLLTQPLLAGAGYGASHEGLIQGERDLVYALRDFMLERQDFAIEILAQYYQVLNQKTVVENTRLNVEQSGFLRKRSEALFKVRRAAYIDVLRSRQQELSARNGLNVAQAEFDTQVKRFLLTLGLPVDTGVELTGRIPEMLASGLDEARCIDLALRRRADLQTVRDRRADASRQLRLARNGLLPELSVYGKADWRSDPVETFGDQTLQEDVSAGVTLNLPLDRRPERDAVQTARIALDAAARALEQRESGVHIEIMESFRRLNTLASTVDIQKQNVAIATQRARNAAVRFRNGELSNRDVVEAENELLNARNAYAQALIDYELQRIRLLRNVGLLDVEADGALIELSGAEAGVANP